jgi:hypothetical protein
MGEDYDPNLVPSAEIQVGLAYFDRRWAPRKWEPAKT